MTLDVTIGKIEIFREYKEDDDYEKYDRYLVVNTIVVECPDLDYDLCSSNHTMWPRKSWRSGNTSFFIGFFESYLPETYQRFVYKDKWESVSVAFLQPVIEEIKALKIPLPPIQADRMKWFKFWCERAVDLYGENAGIMFC